MIAGPKIKAKLAAGFHTEQHGSRSDKDHSQERTRAASGTHFIAIVKSRNRRMMTTIKRLMPIKYASSPAYPVWPNTPGHDVSSMKCGYSRDKP